MVYVCFLALGVWTVEGIAGVMSNVSMGSQGDRVWLRRRHYFEVADQPW